MSYYGFENQEAYQRWIETLPELPLSEIDKAIHNGDAMWIEYMKDRIKVVVNAETGEEWLD